MRVLLEQKQPIVALATQGDWLITGCSFGQLWNLSTGGLVRAFGNGEGSSVTVTAVCFYGPSDKTCPISRLKVATCAGQLIYTWDAQTGACLHVLAGHSGAIAAITRYAQGSSFVTGSKDCTARLWDAKMTSDTPAETRNCAKVFQGHTQPVTCTAVWTGRLVTGSVDFSLRVWNVENEMCAAVIEHTHVVRSLCVHQGALLSLSFDGWLNLVSADCDPQTGAVGWPFGLTRVCRVESHRADRRWQPWAFCSLGRQGVAVASVAKEGVRHNGINQIVLSSECTAASGRYRFDTVCTATDIRAIDCTVSGEVVVSCMVDGSCVLFGLGCHVQKWSKERHNVDQWQFRAQVIALISCHCSDTSGVGALSHDLVCSLCDAMHVIFSSYRKDDTTTMNQ